jgi:hypothetical protein
MQSYPNYHLGIDCATKTFAFSISYVNFSELEESKEQLRILKELLSRPQSPLPKLQSAIDALDKKTKNFIQLLDGEVIDLIPNKPDNKITTVERIKALSAYVKKRIIPNLEDKKNIRVVIEYQMGVLGRDILSALIALLSEYDIIIVGASLKNKIYVNEAGRYCNFAAKYSSSYYANKEHAKYNFAEIEKKFNSYIQPCSKSLRGHIADSFMQVLGYIFHADEKTIYSNF